MMVLLWIEHVLCSFIVLYETRLVCLRWRNTAPEGQPHCAPGGPGGRCAWEPKLATPLEEEGKCFCSTEMCVCVWGALRAIDQQLAMEG